MKVELSPERQADAIHRYARTLTVQQVWHTMRNATDRLHHAPLCAANHYHGMRAPTGPCACGAAEHDARSK